MVLAYYIAYLTLGFFLIVSEMLSCITKKSSNYIAYYFSIFFTLFTLIFFSFRPLCVGADTAVYALSFESAKSYVLREFMLQSPFEHLYSLLAWSISNIGLSFSWFQFILLSVIFGCFIRYVQITKKSSTFLLFILFSFPFFYSISLNTVRSGMSYSLSILGLLLLFKKRHYASLLFLISSLFHVTGLVYLVSYFIRANKLSVNKYIIFWLVSLLISLTGAQDLIITNIPDIGRVTDKLSKYQINDSGYITGFRLDFFIFSALPLFMYLYLRITKICVTIYLQYLMKVYFSLNIIYLIFLFYPYGDRFALMSWILIPFILSEFLFLCKKKHSVIPFLILILIIGSVYIINYSLVSFLKCSSCSVDSFLFSVTN